MKETDGEQVRLDGARRMTGILHKHDVFRQMLTADIRQLLKMYTAARNWQNRCMAS